MAIISVCDECGSKNEITRFTVRAERMSTFQEHLPRYERNLCSSCLDRKIAEYSNFIEGLTKPRSWAS
jgi:hypothetical protein